MNSPTSGPSANCCKLLVSDTTNFFDQNTCFLKDVLVSKQKIAHLLDLFNYSIIQEDLQLFNFSSGFFSGKEVA